MVWTSVLFSSGPVVGGHREGGQETGGLSGLPAGAAVVQRRNQVLEAAGLRGNAATTTTTTTTTTTPPTTWLESSKNRCSWIKDLLAKNEAIGAPLPVPGKDNGNGAVFWLKRPVLHTRDPESGEELVILMYNIYNRDPKWTQHTDKFRNTVQVLLRNEDDPIFPKLFGFCPDIEGFHYIAVEFIDYDVDRLPRPTSLAQCVQRARDAVRLFATLDDKLHLFLADFKPGQWMARRDGSLVLQDVDDILEPGVLSPYEDQVSWLQGRICQETRVSRAQLDKLWQTQLFPRGELNVRYDVLNTKLLLENLGFNWGRDCQQTEAFRACKRALFAWTFSLDSDWPSPAQIDQALGSCLEKGTFDRTRRPAANWRDVSPIPEAEYKAKSQCLRAYDSPAKSGKLSTCGYSCCRAKGSSPCYYTVAAGNSCEELG